MCNKISHIANFCKTNKNNKAGDKSSSEFKEIPNCIEPTPRMIIKLQNCDTDI